MSNSVAEAYLLIVRESNIPIFGEAVPLPFTGQIELDSWSWEVKNRVWERLEEEKNKAKTDGKTDAKGAKGSKTATGSPGSGARDNAALFKPDGLIRQVTEMQERSNLSQEERDKRVREIIKKAVAGYAEAATDSSGGDDEEKTDEEKNAMTLKFDKGVDLATTPLLTALANGEILPKAVLTLFHRAKGAPVALAITMGDIRLKSCDISCDPDDKMADLKEKWEATYQTVDWVYKSRPAAAGPSLGLSLITQGQVRVFAMQQEMPPI
jgi:type VI protein secretion system component Hcp